MLVFFPPLQRIAPAFKAPRRLPAAKKQRPFLGVSLVYFGFNSGPPPSVRVACVKDAFRSKCSSHFWSKFCPVSNLRWANRRFKRTGDKAARRLT